MRSDTPPNPPRGRPPASVLIALTLTAVALHGCLLDGVPLDAPDLPLSVAPTAPAVQVRSVAVPSTDATPLDLVEAVAVTPVAVRAPAPVAPVTAPATRRWAAAEAPHAFDAPPEPPAVVPVSPASVEPSPLALAPEAASASPAPVTPPPVSAPSAASGEPVVLRQPEHAVPVYRTQIPPATTLAYDIRRGSISGTGELSWRPEGSRYEARLEASVIGFTLLTQVSQGGFDKAGLAPLRFTDQRARKAARATNFQREAGKITFSGPRDEFALPAGSQDRLSWMIQLPAVLSAEPKRAAAGGEVVLYVAGARADVDLWTLRSSGTETVETAGGAVRTVKFMRTPRSAKDTQAEVWLDPTRHYLPVRARLTQGGDEADAFELVLRELKTGH